MKKSSGRAVLLHAKEVKEYLEIGDSELYTYIKNGMLHKQPVPGKKYSMYLEQEVKDLKHFLTAYEATAERPVSIFTRAAAEDMTEIARLIYALFDTHPNIERWTNWLVHNPDIAYTLKVDGRIMGCAFILPLTLEKIQNILASQITPPLYDYDIDMFEPGKPLYLYVRTVGIQPNLPHVSKRIWGARLIAGLIDVVIGLGKRGVNFVQIYSRSETPDGIRILKHMGFTEIPTITTSRNFVIDVATSGIPAILEYKQALATWQKEHGQISTTGPKKDIPVKDTKQPATRVDKTALPPGYRGFTDFFKSHGIPETSAIRAGREGNFKVLQNGWRVNGYPVKKSLDPENQARFIQYFRDKKTNIHKCEIQDCPCQRLL